MNKISIFGKDKPDSLKAIVELVFSDIKEQGNYDLVEKAIMTDSLSSEQYRLLPILYEKTDRSQYSELTRGKIESAYKHTFFRNQILIHRAQTFHQALRDEGFSEPIYFKGLAYCFQSGLSVGARPMVDVDLLIRDLHRDPKRLIRFLKRQQFENLGASYRSITTRSPDKFEFDLHWYLFEWALSEKVILALEENSYHLPYRGVSFRLPCIEHHFIYVIAHGLCNLGLRQDARWVVDALILLKANSNLDEEKTIQFANLFSSRTILKNALSLLAKSLPDSIVIDRERLNLISREIRPSHKMTSWILLEEVIFSQDNNKIVLEWMREAFYLTFYVPFIFWRYNQLTLIAALNLAHAFPPLPFYKTCLIILTKIIRRSLRLTVISTLKKIFFLYRKIWQLRYGIRRQVVE